MQRFDFDVVVIGGGGGDYAAARLATAVAADLKTAVIEGGEEIGGLCILNGCMPSKALLFAAEVKHQAEHAKTWDVHARESPPSTSPEVVALRLYQVKDFARLSSTTADNASKFEFIRADAQILSTPHTVGLSKWEKNHGAAFVIATGSRVASPQTCRGSTPRFHHQRRGAGAPKNCRNHSSSLAAEPLPASLRRFFTRFGVQVTVIQRGERLVKEFDVDAALALEKVFCREGIKLFTGNQTGWDVKHNGKLKDGPV